MNVLWDKMSLVGRIDPSIENKLLDFGFSVRQQKYEPLGYHLSMHNAGVSMNADNRLNSQNWRVYVQPYKTEKDERIFGPVELFIEKVRYTDDKLRLEFNPVKISGSAKELLDELLSILTEKHLTRADLAFDVRKDLSAYTLLRPGATSITYRGRSQAVETRYFGAMASEKQIRLYDKQQEMLAHKDFYHEKPDLATRWWRLELQMRRTSSEDFVKYANEMLDQLYCMDDYDKSSMSPVDYAVIFAITERPELMSDFSEYHRKKYRDLLKECKKEDSLSSELKNLLSECEEELRVELLSYVEEFTN